MMFTLHFDCRDIKTRDDFYQQLCQQYPAYSSFGYNLDGLWDWLTGELPLPLTCHFHGLNPQQLKAGQPLATIFAVLHEAQAEQRDLYHIVVDYDGDVEE